MRHITTIIPHLHQIMGQMVTLTLMAGLVLLVAADVASVSSIPGCSTFEHCSDTDLEIVCFHDLFSSPHISEFSISSVLAERIAYVPNPSTMHCMLLLYYEFILTIIKTPSSFSILASNFFFNLRHFRPPNLIQQQALEESAS
jgi:hypothetical protein